MNNVIQFKLCPACHQKNNPAFKECWKCGVSFITGATNPIIRTDGWEGPSRTPVTENPLWGFICCVAVTVGSFYLSGKSNGSDGSLILIGVLFGLISLLYAFVIFSGFRWFVLIILGIWGVVSLFQGMAAVSTTDFLLFLILWSTLNRD